MLKVGLMFFVGVVLYFYNFWLRLKEDYISNLIFSTSFYSLFGMSLFVFISRLFLPQWWFWLGMLGAGLGLLLGIMRFNLRIFETIESAVISYLILLIFVYSALNFLGNTTGLQMALISLGYYLLFLVFDKHYKGFTWYKSGRVGFSGMAVAGLFFVGRAFVAIFSDGVVSFVDNDVILSGIISFISFLMLYNLSRSKS
jgi:hypothetical protein